MLPLLAALAVAAPAIRDGALEPGYPAAVGLGFGGLPVCSGSLVTTKLVLSAAHCGEDLPPELVVDIGQVYFGADTYAPDEVVEIAEAWLHPDYVPLESDRFHTRLPENDVGLLLLDDDAPTVPVPFHTEAVTDADLGAALVSVGFGKTDEAERFPDGRKRSAPLVLDALQEQFLIVDTDTNPGGGTICSGDSGGPVYGRAADGSLVEWGVHSWGDADCRVTSGSTRTDLVSAWILGVVEEVHGTTEACEVLGKYGDGVCDEGCADPDPDCEPERRLACATSPDGAGWAAVALALAITRRFSARSSPAGRARSARHTRAPTGRS